MRKPAHGTVKRKVFEACQDGCATSVEVAAALDISIATASSRMCDLAREGLLHATSRRKYGDSRPGPPAKVYVVAESLRHP